MTPFPDGAGSSSRLSVSFSQSTARFFFNFFPVTNGDKISSGWVRIQRLLSLLPTTVRWFRILVVEANGFREGTKAEGTARGQPWSDWFTAWKRKTCEKFSPGQGKKSFLMRKVLRVRDLSDSERKNFDENPYWKFHR